MRSSIFKPTLVLITSFASTTSALLASTSSPCASQCGNTLDNTSGSDIACSNAEFKSTDAGTVFENCISCQVRSNYVDPVTKESDLHWAIYNIRYAVSWCLFGYPNNENVISTPCTTSMSCGLLEAGFVYDSLSSNASTYGFCALVPAIDVPKCTSCLRIQTSESYLTNFVTALDAACQQQPIPGNTINIEGSLFSTTLVNITTGSARPASTYTPDNHALTLEAKVGIAVGGLVALLSISGFCIVWRGKRRRRRFLLKHQQETGYADWLVQKRSAFMSPQMPSPGGFFDSPQSQRPLVSSQPWARPGQDEESPASGMGEKVYFSPYSSQYSSPTDANDRFESSGSSREWPVDRKSSIGGSSGVRSRSREKHEPVAEIIEMQNVAPVLLHPGHGRGAASHSTKDDVQRGGHAV
ncbi:hypothetical protein LZ554_007056 [Drepanopeziza brunnea f. sp. 'monogermtubi']|nr:hypothetical protein LZ554_007056 [Drepanopeziza brunnea f. sp. 'monogermtubi']